MLLTNKPELFKKSGVYDPALNDDMLIYGIINEKVGMSDVKFMEDKAQLNLQLNQDEV